LPLYVFCGDQPLVSYLRPSNIDAAKHAWAVLALLVKRLRKAWPKVRIILRGDSGFCRWRMMSWCDRHEVGYILGVAKNTCLNALAASYVKEAQARYEAGQGKQRLFADVEYAAATWERSRRVIVKAEHTDKGSNPRYVVTNLQGAAQHLYDEVYCARGEMENRIKEQQLGLFADRTSSHRWWSNQPGVCADGCHPQTGTPLHGTGPSPSRHHPPQAAENRRGRPAQQPPHPPSVLQ
jgi:hypothetical protein